MAHIVTSLCLGDSDTTARPKDAVNQKVTRQANPSTNQGAHNPIVSPGQSTDVATEDFEIASALNLVAVSVAEQRHLATKCLILHPATLTLVALGFAYSVGAVYYDPSGWPYIAVICVTAASATLDIIMRFAGRHDGEAENVGTLNWLYGHDPSKNVDDTRIQKDPTFNSDGGATFVLIHRFGSRIAGALVISITCWRCPPQGPRFANSHVNSLRVFPSLFHSDIDQEFAMWSSYLRKRIEANRQSRSAFEARMLHAPLNHLSANYGQSPRVDARMRLNRIQVKLEELIGRYFDMRLDKAFEAQARWKESS
ncbi:Acyl-CoA N-acyltransferase [Penicillium coprophilum]|uniref:Acyl-CoA N-acyltransferase n=1 Tax=Penicillium coprophilum TaxID=36646 RepID=UPI0023899C24|nr:Acyl-CoA N-acyltransferase [Penicillium coprophilum]KAJ5163834.1 Acyl-CoA N-acyltransferase [Penicillium coprophilum]